MVRIFWKYLAGFLLFIHAVSSSAAMAADSADTNQINPTESSAAPALHDGSTVELQNIHAKITPPAGWQVIKDHVGVTLVIQKSAAPAEEKVTDEGSATVSYQPNLVVATTKQPLAIDDALSSEIVGELMARFSRVSGVSNYNISEVPRMIMMKNGQKALVVNATYHMDGVKLGQMNVIVSGDENSFLLTYTDIGDHFLTSDVQDDAYREAFQTITSFEVSGNPPTRYLEQGITIGATITCFISLLLLLGVLRRRAAKKLLGYSDQSDMDSFESKESADHLSAISSVSSVSNVSSVSSFDLALVAELEGVDADDEADDKLAWNIKGDELKMEDNGLFVQLPKAKVPPVPVKIPPVKRRANR